MSAEKLAEALRLMLAEFDCGDVNDGEAHALRTARAALAAHEAEAKAAPANVIGAVFATTAAIHEAGAMEEIAKYRRLTDVVSEPVAWMVEDADGRHFIFRTRKPVVCAGEKLTPLYAAPVNPSPTPAPLTDGDIVAAANEAFDTHIDLDDGTLVNKYGHGVYVSRYIDFARAIERAHGIGAKP